MMSTPIQLTKLRDLTVQPRTASDATAFISAASGLVRVDRTFHVIADDELHLGMFPVEGEAAGTLLRILPGDLPREPTARKREKPDFEALVRLPPVTTYPNGALLAIGSGSTPRRHRCVLLPLTRSHDIDMTSLRVLDFTAVHAAIRQWVLPGSNRDAGPSSSSARTGSP